MLIEFCHVLGGNNKHIQVDEKTMLKWEFVAETK